MMLPYGEVGGKRGGAQSLIGYPSKESRADSIGENLKQIFCDVADSSASHGAGHPLDVDPVAGNLELAVVPRHVVALAVAGDVSDNILAGRRL
jgi:hypothetical protein